LIRLAHPQLLWLFWLIPIVLFLLIVSFKLRSQDRRKFTNPDMLERLTPGLSNGKSWLKGIIILIALIFLVFAVVDPQIGTRMEEVKREGVDILVAVDVSASMMAEDIKPNRLMKTKHSINAFIDKLRGDRIGILAFAGAAFVQCPLTLDYSAAKMFTDILDTSLIPVQGTAVSEAIKTATASFVGEDKSQKVLVIITDGEDHEAKIDEALSEAKERGIVIYTIGMGSPGGAPIPSQRGYIQDKQGSVVLSRLNETLLTEIALETGGGYYRATSGGDELDKIYNKIFGMDKTELSSRQFTNYEDRFQYFAAAALLLLLMEVFISEKKGAWSKFFKLD